jgi:hypothetical protein
VLLPTEGLHNLLIGETSSGNGNEYKEEEEEDEEGNANMREIKGGEPLTTHGWI